MELYVDYFFSKLIVHQGINELLTAIPCSW